MKDYQRRADASRPERKTKFTTNSGVEVKGIYTPLDVGPGHFLEREGFPGEPPFTRGVYPTMYRGRVWTFRLFSGYGTPEETNQRWRYLYQQGETGFSAAVDALTFNGIDPDDPRADVEVGTSGVPLYCIDSLFALTEGLPIDKISVALVVEPFTAAPICAMYFNVAKARGVDLKDLAGTCQNDILTMCVGFVPFLNVGPSHLLRLACDVIEWTTAQGNVPRWHPINFTTYNYREGGIDAVQEIGFGLANAMAHVDEMLERGWKVDQFAGRLAFHLSAHKDFFEEVAKFRAARRIWYELMKDRYGAKDPASYQFRFHVQTAGSSLTAQQPMVNVVRTSIQALAAVLGGCQSLHTNSYDEAICLPSEEAVLIALRTQQVISEETGVTNVIDPLGGSYYVEWLTDELEERIWKYLDKLEGVGGVVKALESGWLYQEMRDAFQKRQRAVETGEETVIGVNKHVIDEPHPECVFRTNPRAAEIEQKRLNDLKKRRDNAKVEQLLDRLRSAFESGENVMAVVMELTKEGATLGEICDVYREIGGVWNPPITI
ncbi:MAG: methylmalonyl-CoA mutase family protein [Promethearchaeota archaeon]